MVPVWEQSSKQDPAAAITVTELTKQFGKEVTALDRVSLEVPKGEFFGLFGPNGAGKSTLLKILTGQLEPTNGQAWVMGMDPTDEPLLVRAAVGIVPEADSPPSFLTVEEVLEFVFHLRCKEGEDRSKKGQKVQRWLEYFELQAKAQTQCRHLSRGQKQKVMLAAAFLQEPELLFLDEPFINLDPLVQRNLRGWLIDYVKRGGTVLMATHILEMAERMCTRVAIINEGKVVATATKAELKAAGRGLEQTFYEAVGYSFTEDLEETKEEGESEREEQRKAILPAEADNSS